MKYQGRELPALTPREAALQEALKWHNHALAMYSKSYVSSKEYIHFARKDFEQRDMILAANGITTEEFRTWEHNLHEWEN